MKTQYACPPASRLARELNLPAEAAHQLRSLIKHKLDPAQFESVRKWVASCYNEPALIEQIICAANELMEGFGRETIRSTKNWDSFWCDAKFVYINMGDMYVPTLIFNTVSKSFSVAYMADVVDRLATANELTS